MADAITDAIADAQPYAVGAATLAPEPESISPWQSFPAGARYGTLLHDLLEWLSQNNWPVANENAPKWAKQA